MWYLTRGAGTVTLVLLTLSVVLGIVTTVRWSAPPRWPRFVLDALHRNVSLFVLLVLAIHVVTSVLDSFAPIRLTDAILPFFSPYRPLWIGFGALALDLLVAVAITSVLRQRIGFQTWRSVHWLAYACWPIALIHGFGTGTDTKLSWMLALSAACVAAVLLAIMWRIARASPAQPELKAAAVAVTGAAVVALVVFTLAGPLARGWARRSGTPASLLPVAGSTSQVASRSGTRALQAPFRAQLAGSVQQGSASGGVAAVIEIRTTMSGGARGTLRVRISGTPLPNGGVSMTSSRVTLGPPSTPGLYRGQIVALQGTNFAARLSSPAGRTLELRANLRIDSSRSVTGVVSATALGSPGGGG